MIRHEPMDAYPVIVTVTMEHVIWVEGDDQEDAFQRARHDTYELLNDQETLASHDITLRKPGDDFHSYDWETIYEGDYFGPYQGRRFDAHVETWKHHLAIEKRRVEMAACAEAGHPHAEDRTYTADRYCRTCGWLTAVTA